MENGGFQIRYFLGGLSLFLYGMYLFQISIKKVGGKFLRKIIQKWTESPIKGIISGTLTTAILQSSSVISLIILGFVGANIISFENAIGTIIGANIGSTISAWMIAIFGFKLSLDAVALPLIGLAGLASIIFAKKRKVHYATTFLFGFGLLLFGIGFMKNAFAFIGDGFNLQEYINIGLSGFLLLGLLLTALLQSTAITNIIVFTAVSSGLLGFESAMAIIIGSNIGTTVTAILASIGGNSNQKRVTAVHLIYNLMTAVIVFFLITPIKRLLLMIGLEENVIGLAAFHTTFNIIGAIVFYPLINPVAKLVKKYITEKKTASRLTIEDLQTPNAETAIAALHQDLEKLAMRVMQFHLGAFNIKSQKVLQKLPKLDEAKSDKILRDKNDVKARMSEIETIQKKIIDFAVAFESEDENDETIKIVARFNQASINLYQSAKQIADTKSQIDEIADSDSSRIKAVFSEFQDTTIDLYNNAYQAIKEDGDLIKRIFILYKLLKNRRQEFLIKSKQKNFKDSIFSFFKKGPTQGEISSIMSISMYVYNGGKMFLQGLKERLLNEEEMGKLETKVRRIKAPLSSPDTGEKK